MRTKDWYLRRQWAYLILFTVGVVVTAVRGAWVAFFVCVVLVAYSVFMLRRSYRRREDAQRGEA